MIYYFSVSLALLSIFGQSQKTVNFADFDHKTDNLYFTMVQDTTLEKSMERGAELYTDFCMQCHMADGNGVAGTFPPLAKADYLNQNTLESIKAVKYGLQGKITVNGKEYNSAMPKPGLYDDEVADVMNYILNSFGNTHDQIITEKQVAQVEE